MKIGILTLYGGANNYGNKFQNFALQHFFKKSGLGVETIRYLPERNSSFQEKKNLLSRIKRYQSIGITQGVFIIKKRIVKFFAKYQLVQKETQRDKSFEKFEEKNIRFSASIYKNINELKECNKIYNYVITGSDQVWNPYGEGRFDEMFLTFVDRNKRICYAPSFGVSMIPKTAERHYREMLEGFEKLCCREKDGTEIVEQLLNRPCYLTIDPVFLMDKDEWISYATPSVQKKPYLLTYFLGEIPTHMQRDIRVIAKKNKLEIIDIYTPNNLSSEFAGVGDFLSLIANASLFLTNSFHGCAFAIIFHIPFYACERKMRSDDQNMYSRLSSILTKFELCDRKYTGFDNCIMNLDFSNAQNILDEWKQESASYLLAQLV